MATFTNVPIGTSEDLDICKGLALLPTGAARAGLAASNVSAPLFHTPFRILAWDYDASAGYSFFFGLCGPAVAFMYDTDVTTGAGDDPMKVQWTVKSDRMAAGLVFGANFGATAGISCSTWVPNTWYKPWAGGHWVPSWSHSLNMSIDLINLIVALILSFLEKAEKKNTFLQKLDDRTSAALTSSWGMFDQNAGQLLSGNGDPATPGTVAAGPAFTLPINLIELTKPLAPPANALAEFNDALGELGGWIAFGPTIALELPVTLTLDSITVDGNEYGALQFDPVAKTITGSGTAPIGDPPQFVGAKVEHTIGFTLGVGLFFSMGALKVFSVNANLPPFDVSQLAGQPDPPTTAGAGEVCTQLLYPPDPSSEEGGFILEDCVQVTLELPGAVEAGSLVTGTVRISAPLTHDLVIGLSAAVGYPWSPDGAAGVPAAVTVPALQTSGQFTFTPVNACLFGQSTDTGSVAYPVTVTPTGVPTPAPAAQFTVSINSLTIWFPDNQIYLSSSPSTSGTITLPWAAPPGGAQIALTLYDPLSRTPNTPVTGVATFPATVTIPEGQTSAPVAITFVKGGPSPGWPYQLRADGGCALGIHKFEFNVS